MVCRSDYLGIFATMGSMALTCAHINNQENSFDCACGENICANYYKQIFTGHMVIIHMAEVDTVEYRIL